MSFMPRQNRVRQLSETTSPSAACFSRRNWSLTLLTLIGCATLIFGSGVDHNHAASVAVDEDCIVCDSGSAKNLTAISDASAPKAFGVANEVNWTASNPFLSRFNKTAPRAPPAQLAFL